MINKSLEVVLASVPDREDLVAELWFGNSQLGEVRIDGDRLVVDIFANPNASVWTLEYSDLIDLLTAAKHRLQGSAN